MCSVAYANPKKPDPNPPGTIRDHRWTFTPLTTPVDYNVAELSKFALAADPTSSALGVYPDRKGALKIWGLFDQQGDFLELFNYQQGGGFAAPGAIHVQVIGLGHLVVSVGLSVVAELNGDNLVEGTVDLFRDSPVLDKLMISFGDIQRTALEEASSDGYECLPHIAEQQVSMWISVIKKILLRVKAYRHGGAILITPTPPSKHISIKHTLRYARVPEILRNWMKASAVQYTTLELIAEELKTREVVPSELHLDFTISGHERKDAEDAIAGAERFIASLSRVDGAVLMDSEFVVRGFGCELLANGDEGCQFLHAATARPTRKLTSQLNWAKFGTRHRSMIRYCSEDEAAVGFVISHDGPVRAISRLGKKVYMWDNLELDP